MKTFSRICLVAAVVCSLMIVTAPGVHALPRAESQPESRAESGWLGAAFDWVQNLLGSGERAPVQRGERPAANKGKYPTNGACIDPLGRPRPCF